jgi:hypothetical protein
VSSRARTIGTAETTGEKSAFDGLTGLKVVRDEEGTVAGEEDRRARGVVGGGGDGKFGDVQGLKERVFGAVDLLKWSG